MNELSLSGELTILGIETSCDETAVAVIGEGRVLSSVIMGQSDIHSDFGGVVPELASREHGRVITRAIFAALHDAGIESPGRALDAVAVTSGPGLAGALMVGVSAAKALSVAFDLPLVGVDHMEGHLFGGALEQPIKLPALVLLISGGHTQMIAVNAPGEYRYLGGTVDDAAGEAFDKVARMLGLGFPGGPEIEEIALGAAGEFIPFPRAMSHRGLDLSFSGLKTAVLNHLKSTPNPDTALVAASFQRAVVEVLVTKLSRALDEASYRSLCIGGGVAANEALREAVSALARRRGVAAVIPAKRYCTDNGAMIAAAGAFRYGRGDVGELDLGADPSVELVRDSE